MYRGIHAIQLDAKGRFALPTRHRDALNLHSQGKLILTIDTEERCLLLYPLPVWEEIETKIAALPSFNANSRRIQRLLIGHATEVEMDSNGRILLPTLLREYAAVDKQVMLLGQGNKFEVWSDKTWQARREDWLSEEALGDVPDAVKLLSL